jgi:hypothetical protein
MLRCHPSQLPEVDKVFDARRLNSLDVIEQGSDDTFVRLSTSSIKLCNVNAELLQHVNIIRRIAEALCPNPETVNIRDPFIQGFKQSYVTILGSCKALAVTVQRWDFDEHIVELIPPCEELLLFSPITLAEAWRVARTLKVPHVTVLCDSNADHASMVFRVDLVANTVQYVTGIWPHLGDMKACGLTLVDFTRSNAFMEVIPARDPSKIEQGSVVMQTAEVPSGLHISVGTLGLDIFAGGVGIDE